MTDVSYYREVNEECDQERFSDYVENVRRLERAYRELYQEYIKLKYNIGEADER